MSQKIYYNFKCKSANVVESFCIFSCMRHCQCFITTSEKTNKTRLGNSWCALVFYFYPLPKTNTMWPESLTHVTLGTSNYFGLGKTQGMADSWVLGIHGDLFPPMGVHAKILPDHWWVKINRVDSFPPIGGFPPIFHGFLTPLRSVQIWRESRPICRGVCLL